jgi:hypothetical protein
MAQWLFFGPILVATCGLIVLDHRHKWTGTSRTLSEKVAWQPTGISRDQQGSGLLNSPAVKKTPHDLKLDVELYHENALIYIIHTLVTCILSAHIGRWLQTHSTLPGSESNLVWCLSHVLHFPWKDMEWIRVIWGLPSGKRFRSYGKSSFLMHQRTKWPCSMANC